VTSSQVQQVLDRLLALHPKVIDLSLERIVALLAKIGNPEQRLPPTIHVAGTNGKGSTVAMLDAVYRAGGYRVHRYISPHLVRFNERIVLEGEEVSDDMLCEALLAVERLNGDAPITFFEITTAAAFLLFSRVPADVLLLEVGLGGRLDATNVLVAPLCSVITPISFDHQDYLGNTLPEIAAEKAGIMKEGCPVVSAYQPAPVRTVLANKAIALHAPLFMGGLDWQCQVEAEGFTYQGLGGAAQSFPAPALAGEYQCFNASGVLATLSVCHDALPVSLDHIRQGLASVCWPARLQPLRTGTLPALLPEDWSLYVDGSHNPAGGEALAQTLRTWKEQGRVGDIHFIIGMLSTKDVRRFLKALFPLAASVTCVPVPGQSKTMRPADTHSLLEEFSTDCPVRTATTVPEALNALGSQKSAAKATVIITGSLYLAGSVLAL
jgi:dihydrofolate synthase / folylpolyglutamate synthase